MADAALIDGNEIARKVRAEVKGEVESFQSEYGYPPALATVLVGDDPASKVYVDRKKEACVQAGIRSVGHELPANTAQQDIEELVDGLNSDSAVHGILVQLPLPGHMDSSAVTEAICPKKDVDGLTPYNVGWLVQGKECLVPCTAAGVMELLRETGAEIEGAEAVVVGRSNLVGRPLVPLLLAANATVTVCHSKTRELATVCKRADILIAATGSPGLIGEEMVKHGATVIDVGITRTDSGLVGDVDFEAVRKRAGAITPVPGGVGPMTIAMLLKNTLKAARLLT